MAINADRLIVDHINMSIRQHKFEALVKDKKDIPVVSEINSDGSFPSRQFLIEDYAGLCLLFIWMAC